MAADLPAISSILLVGVMGMAMVVLDAFRNDARSIPWLGVGTLTVAAVWEAFHFGAAPGTAFLGSVRTGGFAAFINTIVLGAGALSLLLVEPYLRRMRRNYGEVYALVMFAVVGMLLLGTANNLISIFVGLETMSVCLYVLTGLVREDEGAIESALKYFLLGAFSTGFFLYGMALIYGATGTMYLPEMTNALQAGGAPLLFWAGVALLFIGFMFKVSAAPFHMWTPDVYQGSPTPLTGFMSTAAKASAFASLILVLFYALPSERWSSVLAVVAVLTMVIGNVLALSQANVKRMLAYSSVAHAGYVLVGLSAGTAEGYGGAMFYLLVYTLMNIGAFGVMALLEWDGKEGREQTLDSLAGIGYKRPVLGVAMGVFMFSLTGFPPLGGFMGKVAVFGPAVDAGAIGLVVTALLMSALSAYYYLRVVYVFWMQAPESLAATQESADAQLPRVTPSALAVLSLCTVLLLVLGLFPGGLMETTTGFFEAAQAMATTMP